ncbi:hypothetical protein BZG36_05634 [Bifiguratus adelaidae]|uniref:Uncharacterized protein n=1 Tax=Bifiguratus adelaidae TaxID=1938954 RepID=A0A261XSY8_9FUNG|nr:hypothetical protein BZG36_05634 [Bifiguratus adelaidae]
MSLLFVVTLALCIITLQHTAAELVPLTKYPGKHDSRCRGQTAMTGVMVKNKIYILGGCNPTPYLIDPTADDNDMGMFTGQSEHYNVTDEIYSYNVMTEEWMLEGKSPQPLKMATAKAIGEDVLLYNILWNKIERFSMDFWVFNTVQKTWKQKGSFPFVWHGSLVSCELGRKVIFGATGDGHQRNILHVFDMDTEQWESSIFVPERIELRSMICRPDSIQMVGTKIPEDLIMRYDGMPTYIMILHANKTLEYHRLNVTNIIRVRKAKEDPSDPNVNILTQIGHQINITLVDFDSYEEIYIGSIRSGVHEPLVFTHQDAFYLFGGVKERALIPMGRYIAFGPGGWAESSHQENTDSVDEVTGTFHHKFIVDKLPLEAKLRAQL